MSGVRMVARASVAVAFVATVLPVSAQVPLGATFRVNAYTTGDQRRCVVAVDGAGDFVVVWQGSSAEDGSSTGVFAQRYGSSGAPLGDELRVNAYTSSGQSRPAVSSSSSGTFDVVWESTTQDGSSSGVHGQRLSIGGTVLGGEFRVNSYTTGPQFYSAVGSAPSGEFVVVWGAITQDGQFGGVFGQRYASGGSITGSEFLVNTYTTQDQGFPRVARNASGDFVVVWQSTAVTAGSGQDGDSGGVFGQRFASSGTPLGAEFRVNTYTTGQQVFPDVASDPAGDFVVVWSSFYQDGDFSGVYAQRFSSSGSPAGGEFRVNASTSGSQDRPHAAFDAAGEFVVVFSHGAPGSYGFFARRFSSDGAARGSDFLVSSSAPSSTFGYASIASDAAGDFIVAWDESGPDGAGFGVFAQRYCFALSALTISVAGATDVCPGGTGGTASVFGSGGGTLKHQWGYRNVPMGTVTDLPGETADTYLISSSSFPGKGVYALVCTTTPSCGSELVSNEITVTIDDAAAPVVAAPGGSTVTQSLCQ